MGAGRHNPLSELSVYTYLGYDQVMGEDTERKRRGRPPTEATGKKQRNLRLGAAYDLAAQLATQLAERDGRPVNVTAYVEAALDRENARVQRLLRRTAG
jgi:hypothetical protein